MLVNSFTSYSLYERDDYKRCVCDSWGNGESDCPQKIANTAPYIPDWDQHNSVILLDNAPVSIFTVPTVLDAEGDSWTVSVDIDEITGFATFESSIESIIFDIAETNTQAGIYRVTLSVDDGTDQNNYVLEITVVKVNTAPYFVNWEL